MYMNFILRRRRDLLRALTLCESADRLPAGFITLRPVGVAAFPFGKSADKGFCGFIAGLRVRMLFGGIRTDQ